MNVQFVSTAAVIAANPEKSRELFVDALGLPLEGDDYAHSERIEGVKHFGVWPLAQAAQACFGSEDWPADRPVPQVSIEFDVENPEAVEAAAQELEARASSWPTARVKSPGADRGATRVERGRDHRNLVRALDAPVRVQAIGTLERPQGRQGSITGTNSSGVAVDSGHIYWSWNTVSTNVPPPACNDGQDNDGDTLIDAGDPECTSTQDASERTIKLGGPEARSLIKRVLRRKFGLEWSKRTHAKLRPCRRRSYMSVVCKVRWTLPARTHGATAKYSGKVVASFISKNGRITRAGYRLSILNRNILTTRKRRIKRKGSFRYTPRAASRSRDAAAS